MEIQVCTHSGQRAGPNCVDTETIHVPRSTSATPVCSYCQVIHCVDGCRWRAHGDCESVDNLETVRRFVLPPASGWFYRQRHTDYTPLPPWQPDCTEQLENPGAFGCLYPKEGANEYVPVELDGRRGRVGFEAAHRRVSTTIFWHLDDTYVGTTESVHQLALMRDPGWHTLTLVDEYGESLQRRFHVLEKPRN